MAGLMIQQDSSLQQQIVLEWIPESRTVFIHPTEGHDLPEDVRRSLIKKMDHLERMIQTAKAPYRKKRCYYARLDHEIKKSVTTYVDSISKDTLTAIEKLDIKEFNESRKVDADHVGAVNIRKRAGDREILELCKEHQYSHKNLQNAIRIVYEKRHIAYKTKQAASA